MNRFFLLLTALLLLAPSAQAGRKKTVKTPLQLVYQEPDALPPVVPAANPLARQVEVTLRRHRGHTTGKKGIDVSHYQNNINWEAVAKDREISYVYIKATENAGLVDSRFQTNLREARRVGIPVGCYHFFSPTASPMAQLKNLTTAVPHLSDHDLVPMIDVEVKGRASVSEMRNRLRQFLKGVEEYYRVKPIVYSGQNFYNKYLAGYFEDYLFMIAKYSEGMPELNGNAKFAMWQYTSSGRVRGIQGSVDWSCFVDGYGLRDILIKRKK